MLRWTIRLEGGPRRVNHAAVAIGDKIYSFGGYCTGEDYETTRPIDVHVLDTITYRWSTVTVSISSQWDRYMPYQRYGHTCVAYEDKAYVWGGRNDRDGACSVLFCFDPAARKWSRPDVSGNVPGARDGHSACVIGHSMYIFGGYEEDEDRFSNDIHQYNFHTKTWTLLVVTGTPASWRDFHSATPFADRFMIVFGGRSDYGAPFHTNHEFYCQKVHVFDTCSKRWTQPRILGDGPFGRRSHSAFVHNNLMYIFGGYNGNEDRHYADLWCLDPSDYHWKKLHPRGGIPITRRPLSPIPTVDDLVGNGGPGVNAVVGAIPNDAHPHGDGDRIPVGNGLPIAAPGAPIVDVGRAPCARRRQCCCVVNDTVILFGGTSPAAEPMEDSEFNLMDHSDLYVLDFYPSLKTLCLIAVVDHKLDTSLLPRDLQWDIISMTTNSNISRPLANNG